MDIHLNLLVVCYLNTSENIPNIGKAPQRNVRHLETAFIVNVGVTVNLVDFIVHQSLSNQAVHPNHMSRSVLVWIKFASATEQNLFKKLNFTNLFL